MAGIGGAWCSFQARDLQARDSRTDAAPTSISPMYYIMYTVIIVPLK